MGGKHSNLGINYQYGPGLIIDKRGKVVDAPDMVISNQRGGKINLAKVNFNNQVVKIPANNNNNNSNLKNFPNNSNSLNRHPSFRQNSLAF
jgi:hypothetical protein